MITKTKVLLLINSLGSGGAQTQIVLLASELSRRNLDVHLMHYSETSHVLSGLHGTSVTLHEIVRPARLGRLALLPTVLKYIRDLGPDVVVSFLDAPNLICGVGKLLQLPYSWIACERNLCYGQRYGELIWRRILYRLADRIATNSQAQLQWMLKNVPDVASKSLFVPNGIRDELFSSNQLQRICQDRPSKRFVVIGRLSAQKNPDLLVNALKLLPLDARSLLVINWFGDEDPTYTGRRVQFARTSQTAGLPISFYPAVSNPLEQMRAHDALILCSDFEGTPNVVLEAMSQGVPVIASDVSDLPAILDHGNRGLLFKSRSPRDLADTLLKFLALPSPEVSRLAGSALSYARSTYSSTKMANQYFEMISEVVR